MAAEGDTRDFAERTVVGWHLLFVLMIVVTGVFLTREDADIAERAAALVLVVWPLFIVNSTNIIFSCYLTAVERPGPSASIALIERDGRTWHEDAG